MGREKVVNDLFKFLKADVTTEKLFEASDKAYEDVLKEGKLPADPSQIQKPMDDVQKLSEKEKEVKSGEKSAIPPAPVTEVPKESKPEQNMDKATPGVEKTADADAQKAGTSEKKEEKKEDKKEEPKVEEKKTEEGKLPADPSTVQKPMDDVQKLAEKEEIFTVSNEDAAKEIAAKFPGSRFEQNKEGGFTVYVKEKKTTEPAAKAATSVPGVDAEQKTDKLTSEKKEDKKEEKKEEAKVEEKKVCDKCKNEKCTCSEAKTDEEIASIAEKTIIVEYLSKKRELSEAETKFVNEVKAISISESDKKKVDEKVEALRKEMK